MFETKVSNLGLVCLEQMRAQIDVAVKGKSRCRMLGDINLWGSRRGRSRAGQGRSERSRSVLGVEGFRREAGRPRLHLRRMQRRAEH